MNGSVTVGIADLTPQARIPAPSAPPCYKQLYFSSKLLAVIGAVTLVAGIIFASCAPDLNFPKTTFPVGAGVLIASGGLFYLSFMACIMDCSSDPAIPRGSLEPWRPRYGIGTRRRGH